MCQICFLYTLVSIFSLKFNCCDQFKKNIYKPSKNKLNLACVISVIKVGVIFKIKVKKKVKKKYFYLYTN